MNISLSDGLLLGVVGLSAVAYVTPTLAAALEARKATRLARIVAAGGRLAAQIAVELRGVPPGISGAELKARLVADAVQRLKSPELMGATVAALKGSDAGLANIIQGELSRLQLAVPPAVVPQGEMPHAPAATVAPLAAEADISPLAAVPLTPSAAPTPYPATPGVVARTVPLLLAVQVLAACALPQSRANTAFETEAAYIAAARTAVAYRLAPGADPVTVSTLRRLDRDAYDAVAESRADPGDAAKLAVAQQAVRALGDFMRAKGMN